MTCIVGCVEGGKTFLGADSFSGNTSFQLPNTSPKIVKKGCLTFGIAGSWRLNQIISHDLKFLKEKPKNLEKYVVSEVLPKIQEAVDSIRVFDDPINVDFLIGCKGQLYHVQNDFAFTENPEGYDCSGMGWEPALATLKLCSKLPPKARLRKALEVAEEFCPLVRRPFHFKEC